VNAQSRTLAKLVRQMKEGCKKDEEAKESTLCGLNPCLKCLQPDILYHLGLNTETTDFPKVFGDVRVSLNHYTQVSSNYKYAKRIFFAQSLYAWEVLRVGWKTLPTT